MDIGKKTIATGAGLFLLGGLSIYLLINTTPATTEKPANRQHSAMREAIAQLEHKEPIAETGIITNTPVPETDNNDTNSKPEMTHSAFLAEAEMRREQQQIAQGEAERIEKLRKAKLNSVECKFWKQQQERQTSSTAAKVATNIDEHCVIAQDRINSSSSEGSTIKLNASN